jgi:hypothetical protein
MLVSAVPAPMDKEWVGELAYELCGNGPADTQEKELALRPRGTTPSRGRLGSNQPAVAADASRNAAPTQSPDILKRAILDFRITERHIFPAMSSETLEGIRSRASRVTSIFVTSCSRLSGSSGNTY